VQCRDGAAVLDIFDDDDGLAYLGTVEVLELRRYGVRLALSGEVLRGGLEDGARDVAAIGDYDMSVNERQCASSLELTCADAVVLDEQCSVGIAPNLGHSRGRGEGHD
jgi:hypothetical protein